MANFKVVVSDPKSRKAFQKEIEQKASGFMGKKISDKVKGDPLGLSGYEFQITGGSDAQGFPMRRDVDGIARKRLLLSIGPGFHPETRGQRKRKSVRGNTISPEISQINAKVVTYGSKPLEQLLGETKKEKKEKLTEEEKKKELQNEVESMLDKKAPEKSRSEQILDEQTRQEKAKAPKEEDKSEGKPRAESEERAGGKKEGTKEPSEESKGNPEKKSEPAKEEVKEGKPAKE